MSGMRRDFSKQAIEHLRKIIKQNVDEEDEFFLVDWVHDWCMDDLNIDNYINDIDTYHAKMVDKHDMNTKKFDAILEKIHSVDISYADRFNCVYEGLNSFNSKIMNVTALIDPSAVTLDTSSYDELIDGVENIHTKNMKNVNDKINADKSELDEALREVPWYESALDFVAGAGVELVKNNIEGLCYVPFGIIGCFTDRVSNEKLDEALTGLENKYVLPHIKDKQAYYYGKAAGDVITIVEGAYGIAKGLLTIASGITLTGGGFVLEGTGVFAPVGALVQAISVPIVLAGTAELTVATTLMATGGGNFNKNIQKAQHDVKNDIKSKQGNLDKNLKSNGFKDKIKDIDDNFLDDMEGPKGIGGHTESKHIGKSKTSLQERIKTQKVSGATSYTNKDTATKAVKDVFGQNSNKIESWLKNPKSNGRLTLNTEHDFSLGYGISRSTGVYQEGIKKTTTVLIKDSTRPLGFYVLTSYPSLK